MSRRRRCLTGVITADPIRCRSLLIEGMRTVREQASEGGMLDSSIPLRGNAPPGSLAICPILQGIAPETLDRIETSSDWIRAPANTVLVEAKDTNEEMYFIVEGSARVCLKKKDDQEINLTQLNPGDVFGEISALDGKGRSSTVITLTDVLAARCPGTVFHSLLRSDSELSYRFLIRFAAILRRADAQIARLTSLSPAQRVCLELLRLAMPSTHSDDEWIISPAPLHKDIAAWAGTTVEDVGKAFGYLMRKKLLRRSSEGLHITGRGQVERIAHARSGAIYDALRAQRDEEV